MHDNDLTGTTWRRSSYSGNSGNCVEVAAILPGVVAVRDSKDPDAAVIAVRQSDWAAFVRGLKLAYPACSRA